MKKFSIPIMPKTTVKTISFPNDIIAKVENQLKITKSFFSAFVIAAVQYALDDINAHKM